MVAVLGLVLLLLGLDLTTPRLIPPDHVPSVVTRSGVQNASEGASRDMAHLLLRGPDGDLIDAAVSLPKAEAGPVPVVIVIGGFGSAPETLRRVATYGSNAIVAYGWPDRELLQDDTESSLRRILAAHHAIHRVPVQIAALTRWAAAQPWADRQRLVLVGVSLGAVVLPAAEQLLATSGLARGPTVLAYGGVGLSAMAERNLRRVPEPWRRPAAAIIGFALRRVEPGDYLSAIHGPLLIIRPTTDAYVPQSSIDEMIRRAPDSKTVVTLDGGHIHPKSPETLAALLRASRAWLQSLDAVNAD
ncbi:MAG TPA: hypothetical protein VD978_24865 [Azospirillum sp.]|nr:hypothetical protein [Azospirillum sp.]